MVPRNIFVACLSTVARPSRDWSSANISFLGEIEAPLASSEDAQKRIGATPKRQPYRSKRDV